VWSGRFDHSPASSFGRVDNPADEQDIPGLGTLYQEDEGVIGIKCKGGVAFTGTPRRKKKESRDFPPQLITQGN
jgi:hypothetical protein